MKKKHVLVATSIKITNDFKILDFFFWLKTFPYTFKVEELTELPLEEIPNCSYIVWTSEFGFTFFKKYGIPGK